MENKLLILLKNLKIESQANILKEGKIIIFLILLNIKLVMKLNFLIKMNYYYIPDTF